MSSRLEPTSSTTDSATSPTISNARNRPPRAPDDPRVASFSVVDEIGLRRVQRRHQADEHGAHERRARDERPRAPVQREHGVRRQLLRGRDGDARERPCREQRAERAGDDGEDHALDQELRDDVRARGAERLPDRDLLVPAGEPADEKTRDVRARDQQHEADRAEQRVERRLEVADDRVDEVARLADVVGVELGAELLRHTTCSARPARSSPARATRRAPAARSAARSRRRRRSAPAVRPPISNTRGANTCTCRNGGVSCGGMMPMTCHDWPLS